MNKSRRLNKSRNGVIKAHKRLERATAERIMVENNPSINLLNYPFYKLARLLKEKWSER